MRIVLLGPPGVGKGTLSGRLRDSFHLAHISTGDMLREEIKKGSALGLEIKALIDKGALVSDELVTKLVKQKVEHELDLSKGIMFDGFPRTETQAEDLDKILQAVKAPLDFVLNMDADYEILFKRLTGRRLCRKCGALYNVTFMPSQKEGICDKCGGELYQRSDDNEKTIGSRMEVYRQSVLPIIEHYSKQNKLKRVNANVEVDDIFKAVAPLFK
ncbi:MAG: adenylate kinase [Candidatus Omnitrophica bacterium]|nr:adenylate kinase [Candidatus Omnitrophota bacterium]